MLEFARTVTEAAGSSSEIVFRELPEDDPKNSRPDITRARELLGWEPQVDRANGSRCRALGSFSSAASMKWTATKGRPRSGPPALVSSPWSTDAYGGGAGSPSSTGRALDAISTHPAVDRIDVVPRVAADPVGETPRGIWCASRRSRARYRTTRSARAC